jgi:hypothetical protein
VSRLRFCEFGLQIPHDGLPSRAAHAFIIVPLERDPAIAFSINEMSHLNQTITTPTPTLFQLQQLGNIIF